jgi:hypothetical protein
MKLDTVRGNIKSFGVARALADVALRAANRLVLVKVLKGIRIEAVDGAFLDCDAKYRGMFLDEPTLRQFAADPQNELTHSFLDDALAKGDECYGFLAGSALAAYGWYSRKPTDLELPGLRLQFSDRHVYMYKGFTAAAHRGQRLHAIGMTRALESYLSRGYRGIVSYVEWNNFASLKSCYRMGYRDFGNIGIAGLGGHYVLHHDAGCRENGFRLERIGKSESAWIPPGTITTP